MTSRLFYVMPVHGTVVTYFQSYIQKQNSMKLELQHAFVKPPLLISDICTCSSKYRPDSQ